jgi:AAA domain
MTGLADYTIDRDEPPPGANARSGRNSSRSKATAQPFPFVLARDIIIEPKEYLIDGFLGLREQSGFFGQPDSGKSSIVIHAACCVAAGMAFCGRAVHQGPVLFVAAERGAVVRRRVAAWCLEHGISDPPIAVVDAPIDFRSGEMDAARIIETANSLSKVCGSAVVWTIFDTVARIMSGGDENSPKDMGALIANVDKVYRATGAHCSLVHHVPVDRDDRMRGHSSLLAALDTTARVSKTNGIVTVTTDKGNDLVDKPAFAFTFKSVRLDEKTTAPVAVPTDLVSVAAIKAAKMPKGARIALRALQEAVEQCGKTSPASNYIPQRIRVATVDQWREYAYRLGISAADTSDRARQKAFQRATEHLIANKHAGIWQQTVWLAGGGAS